MHFADYSETDKLIKVMHSLLRMSFLLSFLIVFLATSAQAEPAVQETPLDKVYIRHPFRIWYDMSPELNIRLKDQNGNNIPDQIEDTATQLEVARWLFHTVYNFSDPLQSERYLKRKPTYIDVIYKVSNENFKTGNGVAFSSSTQARKEPNGVYSLKIHLASKLDPVKNVTPIHEYFHLIQYGATYFRNGWFLEGLARWSEELLVDRSKFYKEKEFFKILDLSDEDFDKLLYNANEFVWMPFIMTCGEKGRFSEAVRSKYKFVDGQPVIKDEFVYGTKLISEYLKCLKGKEDAAAKHFKSKADWIQNGQRSPSNTAYLKQCIEEKARKCRYTKRQNIK